MDHHSYGPWTPVGTFTPFDVFPRNSREVVSPKKTPGDIMQVLKSFKVSF